MLFTETKLKGVYLIEPVQNRDVRGYFMRSFCQNEVNSIGLFYNIAQINRSMTSVRGTIRGMHYQNPPKAEDKIVQCLKGSIFDVAIDLRKDSATYREWIAEELTEENHKMLLIPKGFAHGFQTLVSNCEIQYFVSEFYAPEFETGIRWDDPIIDIKWPISNPSMSEKDRNWPLINI